MVTMQIKKLIETLSIDKKVELNRVLEEAEKAGISKGFAKDAIGRLASEGFISVRDGVVRVVK